jgi:uncharacterized protein (TIGR01777 family)
MIGRAIVRELKERGDEPVALSRNVASAREALGGDVEVHEWADPKTEPAPAAAFTEAEGVIHLLGEPVAQRWSDSAKEEIRDSRVLGTRNLVAGMREAGPRLGVLVSQSASGYYGPRGDEPIDESTGPGDDFLARVVVDWEAEARKADEELGLRVVLARTGVVLSESGGALEKMLPPFKMGVGGPVAGGKQYVPWIHADDVVGALLYLLDNEEASGPVNLSAPRAATNKELSKSLGKALHRPSVMPVPGFAVKILYGEMASIVTTGARLEPSRLVQLGYDFRHPQLDEALRSVTG